jgi:endonuclease SegE-like protein
MIISKEHHERAKKSGWLNLPDDWHLHLGFVYMIECPSTGRYYLGKKLFTSSKRKKLAGAARVQRLRVESDWMNYWGSCKELVADIQKLGKESFLRTILAVKDTKTDLAYTELIYQIQYDVMNDPFSYNRVLNVRLHIHKEAYNPEKHLPCVRSPKAKID